MPKGWLQRRVDWDSQLPHRIDSETFSLLTLKELKNYPAELEI